MKDESRKEIVALRQQAGAYFGGSYHLVASDGRRFRCGSFRILDWVRKDGFLVAPEIK